MPTRLRRVAALTETCWHLPRSRQPALSAEDRDLNWITAPGIEANTLTPPVRAAADLARTLRRRGLVAAGSAGTDDTGRVRVFSRLTARLAGQAYLTARDGTLWLRWADQPPRPAGDLTAAADTITRALIAQTETAAASAGEPARGEVP